MLRSLRLDALTRPQAARHLLDLHSSLRESSYASEARSEGGVLAAGAK